MNMKRLSTSRLLEAGRVWTRLQQRSSNPDKQVKATEIRHLKRIKSGMSFKKESIKLPSIFLVMLLQPMKESSFRFGMKSEFGWCRTSCSTHWLLAPRLSFLSKFSMPLIRIQLFLSLIFQSGHKMWQTLLWDRWLRQMHKMSTGRQPPTHLHRTSQTLSSRLRLIRRQLNPRHHLFRPYFRWWIKQTIILLWFSR